VLAVLTTHPIQYQIPIWKALSVRRNVPLHVIYMSDLGFAHRCDPGFGSDFAWDIDLLTGYDHEFIKVQTGSSQSSFLWLRLGTGFGKMLKAMGVRVLWVQGWQVAAYWQAVREARRVGVQVWLRGETNLRSNAGGPLKVLKRGLLSRLLARVDRFLYIGEANRQFYISQGIRANQMMFAPYCVDNARFAAQASRLRSQRQALRRHWCIPEDAFCFLFLGKLISKKRPGDLVDALRGLRMKGTKRPLHLLFVGTGELDDALRQACLIAFDEENRTSHGRNAGPAASFAGFLNQTAVSQAYVAADCLVLPSDARETWGLVVNEAMASGLPCVTSDACGCTEDLILPTYPELSYPVGDIARLQQSLEAVMTNQPSSHRLIAHIDNYDVLRTVETVERLYADACNGTTA